MLRAAREEQAAEAAAQARADDRLAEAITWAPLARRRYELRRAEADAAEHRAEVARAREREQRKADIEDYHTRLLMSGYRPRSHLEILAHAGGLPG